MDMWYYRTVFWQSAAYAPSASSGYTVRCPILLIRCSAKFRKKSKLKNIFVGNLSFGTTEGSIRSMFESYGTVERVNVVTDRDTGQARGFAFVEMAVEAEGDAAINGLNGKDLDGRQLNINEARPKTERGSGGGGYRGNGGLRDKSRW